MNKEILRLAIPNIISNITVPLLGLVDMYIVGHLDSPDYIAAIALSTMIFNFIYWSFAFLRMGTSGFTAQAFGAKNDVECVNILLRSLTVAGIIGLIILLLQPLIALVGFSILDGSSTTKEYAQNYFYIYIWSAPAIFGMYAFNGWFVGMQNSKTPMMIAIVVNVVNILFNFILVYGLKMKIEGVALASVLAQYIGLGLSIIICRKKYKNLTTFIDFNVLKDFSKYIPFFKVNGNIFLRTMALIAVTTFFMSTSARFGEDILSVNALLMQTFLFYSFFMDGFAYAAEALTGKLVGASNKTMLTDLIKRLFAWGVVISLIFTIVYGLFMNDILSFITDKQHIVALSEPFQRWTMLIPFAGMAAFLWDGIFIGATASRQMRNSMIGAAATFFICYFLFVGKLGNDALWIAFLSYLFLRGLLQTFMARNILKRA